MAAASNDLRDALRKLSVAPDESSSVEAYHQVLDAVGNNHQGTLRRDALAAVRPLLDIALADHPWAASAALDLLIEFTTSFSLEPELATDDSEELEFHDQLISAVAAQRVRVEQLASQAGHERTRIRTAELLQALDVGRS